MSLNKTLKRLGIVMAVIVIAASCATDSSHDLRLVNRTRSEPLACLHEDPDGRCESVWESVTFSDIDSDRVVNRTKTMKSIQTEFSDDVLEVECDGVVFSAPFSTRVLSNFEVSGYELVFENDSTLALVPDTGLFVNSDCMEESGQWEGTAGAYLGSSGAYRLTVGIFQTELILSSFDE